MENENEKERLCPRVGDYIVFKAVPRWGAPKLKRKVVTNPVLKNRAFLRG